ncbi:MAG: hypothetical protein GC150_11460 [Rhizobiales bacterium]|nr:hypothetical protein [Hyphomicrobiales bacterium]
MIYLEALSYLVTILGFPVAILVFLNEERRQRRNEASELHRNLSEEYDNFLRLTLDNADLLLMSRSHPPATMTAEQSERRLIIFRMLVSLFEKAYIILYDDDMDRDARRRWLSWEDDMREWCRRDDFRLLLPELLEGEDDAFSAYITDIAAKEHARLMAR